MTDAVPPLITLPAFAGAAGDSWNGLFDLADELPDGWRGIRPTAASQRCP